MKSAFRILLLCATLFTIPGYSEVISSSDSHFVLRHEGRTSLSPAATWERLVAPASWWDPAHSYSGDAANLSLDLTVGGLWREEWEGGSVSHGRILFIDTGKTLRLEAPFGPLQGLGAYVIWTISLEANDGGTRIVFDETAVGPPVTDYGEIARAVDFVKSEALRRLSAAP